MTEVPTITDRLLRDVVHSDVMAPHLGDSATQNAANWRFLSAALEILEQRRLLIRPAERVDLPDTSHGRASADAGALAALAAPRIEPGDTVALTRGKAKAEDEVKWVSAPGEELRLVFVHHPGTYALQGVNAWTLVDHQPAPAPTSDLDRVLRQHRPRGATLRSVALARCSCGEDLDTTTEWWWVFSAHLADVLTKTGLQQLETRPCPRCGAVALVTGQPGDADDLCVPCTNEYVAHYRDKAESSRATAERLKTELDESEAKRRRQAQTIQEQKQRTARVRALLTTKGPGISCAGYSLTDDGCLVADLAKRINAALDGAQKYDAKPSHGPDLPRTPLGPEPQA